MCMAFAGIVVRDRVQCDHPFPIWLQPCLNHLISRAAKTILHNMETKWRQMFEIEVSRNAELNKTLDYD